MKRFGEAIINVYNLENLYNEFSITYPDLNVEAVCDDEDGIYYGFIGFSFDYLNTSVTITYPTVSSSIHGNLEQCLGENKEYESLNCTVREWIDTFRSKKFEQIQAGYENIKVNISVESHNKINTSKVNQEELKNWLDSFIKNLGHILSELFGGYLPKDGLWFSRVDWESKFYEMNLYDSSHLEPAMNKFSRYMLC